MHLKVASPPDLKNMNQMGYKYVITGLTKKTHEKEAASTLLEITQSNYWREGKEHPKRAVFARELRVPTGEADKPFILFYFILVAHTHHKLARGDRLMLQFYFNSTWFS